MADKGLGDRVVFVNAAGCFSLLALYPFTPFRGSWLYTTMGSAPAGAQGIRDALDILRAKGKLSADEDLQVVVLAGDGSTYDIALSATSGTLFRNLDYWYTSATTTRPMEIPTCSSRVRRRLRHACPLLISKLAGCQLRRPDPIGSGDPSPI